MVAFIMQCHVVCLKLSESRSSWMASSSTLALNLATVHTLYHFKVDMEEISA